MKSLFPILLFLTLLCPATAEKDGGDDALDSKVQKAIQEFNKRKNNGTQPDNEAVVVLPPPGAEPSAEEETAEEVVPAATKPTLVTGKPPTEEPAESVTETSEEEAPAAAEPPSPPEIAPAEKEGLGIRIEPIREGTGDAFHGQIKLKASFPAKALATTPDGWILEKSAQAPAFLEEVTLRPGKTVSLSISPHVLVPASDGESTFGVVESGFDSSKGYRQSNTVSAILGNSVVQLDRDALLLGNAISDLHQLLASLPKPELEPEPATKP